MCCTMCAALYSKVGHALACHPSAARTPHLTAHARFAEPEPYAPTAGDRPGRRPGTDRVSADIKYRPPIPHLLALRLAVGRLGFRYRSPHGDPARGPALLRPRLDADHRPGLRHTHEGR